MNLTLVTQILRGYNYQQVEAVAMVLLESKYVRNLEVTLNSDHALEIIQKLSHKFKDQLRIGAGTVCNLESLQASIDHGATFVLSPVMMSDDMLSLCTKHNVTAIPGALSPSEIYMMHQKGASIIKVFPSEEFSCTYAKKVKEPLEDVRLMAVGGVNTSNVKAYLEGSYDYIGTAGGIFKKEDILACDHQRLQASLKAFEAEIDSYMNSVQG